MLRVISAGLTCATLATAAAAAPVTSSSFFGGTDTIIDFDSLVVGNLSLPISETEYLPEGVIFSSEQAPNSLQTTDPGDASNRFGAAARVFLGASVGGGGAPTSGANYVGPTAFLNASQNTSDFRFDFTSDVLAFGMQVIDNDFSTGRLQAFSANGTLLETVVIPQVGEGGFGFFGIDQTGTGNTISYAILDGNNGAVLDSTFIDDFSFRGTPSPVPLPAGGMLLLTALGGVAALKRRRKKRA